MITLDVMSYNVSVAVQSNGLVFVLHVSAKFHKLSDDYLCGAVLYLFPMMPMIHDVSRKTSRWQ